MNAIRSHHISRRICLALVFVMLASVMPVGLIGAFAGPQAKTVLIFPLQKAAENAPADAGQRATGALTMAVGDSPGLDAIQFSTTSPMVRRAVSEGRIRQVDVEEGDRDLATALVIGAALQIDYVVVSAVQSFTRKDAPPSVEVILAGQMYEVAPNINPATGEPVAEPKVFKAFGVSGASTVRSRRGMDEGAMLQEALRSAAGKAAAALSGRADIVTSSGAKGRNGNYKWVIFGLLIAGLALAVNNGNGSAPTGPGADVQAVQYVSLEETQGAITVSWPTPSNTTLTVLRFQIDRSVDGAAFQRIDPGTLGPGTTFYNDYALTSGRHSYKYRVRVVYTSGAVSVYTSSSPHIVTS